MIQPARPRCQYAEQRMFWGILAIYLALAVATARTLMPWCDEAWFSGPALHLLRWARWARRCSTPLPIGMAAC